MTMETMPYRDKRKAPLVLEGKYVILHEICPKFFKYIVKWRNDKRLNKYLNQSFELTEEKERDWYDNVYCEDCKQGFLVMVDRNNSIPFGTIGWTDYDAENRRLVEGRILRALPEYKKTRAYEEAYILMGRFFYKYVDIVYAHVVRENIASIKRHERIGFKVNEEKIVYPHEVKKGELRQYEFIRTKEDFIANMPLAYSPAKP